MLHSTNALFIKASFPFFILSAFENLAPIYPLYMIMFQSRGLDYRALSLLLVIWSAPVVLLELPSGILADRWSKRGVIAIGMSLKCIAFLCWACRPDFAGACAGFILWGCREAFCSGSRQALLYEALRDRGLEGDYEKAAGACETLGMAFIVISMASGGFLYAANPNLALFTSSASAAMGACFALTLGKGTKSQKTKSAEFPRLSLRGQLNTLRLSFKTPGLIGLAIAASLAGAAFGTVDEYNGLWSLERYRLPLSVVGLWAILPFGAQGLGGLIAGKTARFLNGGAKRMPVALALAGALFIAASLLPDLWGMLPYLAFYLCLSAIGVIFEGRIQASAADESRATLISLYSLVVTLIAMLLSPIFGLMAMKDGLATAFCLMGGLCAAAGVILGLSRGDIELCEKRK